MRTLGAVVSGLLCAIAGFLAFGLGSASLLVSVLGDHDGGTSMGGFFVFGPIGAFAGLLLGIGLALRFQRRASLLSKGLLIASGVISVFGGILLAAAALPDRRPSYSYVIEFQLQVPAASLGGISIPGPQAMWGAAGGGLDDKPISQFFQSTCQNESCLLNGSIAAVGEMSDFHVKTKLGQNVYRYSLDVPPVVTGPLEWSAWRSSEGARVRWRIVKR